MGSKGVFKIDEFEDPKALENDCLECRLLGLNLLIAFCLKRRLTLLLRLGYDVWSGWLYLLLWHESVKSTTNGDWTQQVEIQIWFSTVGNCDIVCHPRWLGHLSTGELISTFWRFKTIELEFDPITDASIQYTFGGGYGANEWPVSMVETLLMAGIEGHPKHQAEDHERSIASRTGQCGTKGNIGSEELH